jgi:IclR family pca regulon transcriptional regulator
VLLAGLPPEELEAQLAQVRFQPHTARTARNLDELRTRVDQVRSQGWCLINQELEEGLVSLAAPIVDRNGHTIAALNVGAQVNRTPPETLLAQCLPRLLEAAQSISRLLQIKS